MRRLATHLMLGKVSVVSVDSDPKSTILTTDERVKLDELNDLLDRAIGVKGIDVDRIDRFARLSLRLGMETDRMSVMDRMNTITLAINIVTRLVNRKMTTVVIENVVGMEKFEETVSHQRDKMGDEEGIDWEVIGTFPNRELQWNLE